MKIITPSSWIQVGLKTCFWRREYGKGGGRALPWWRDAMRQRSWAGREGSSSVAWVRDSALLALKEQAALQEPWARHAGAPGGKSGPSWQPAAHCWTSEQQLQDTVLPTVRQVWKGSERSQQPSWHLRSALWDDASSAVPVLLPPATGG